MAKKLSPEQLQKEIARLNELYDELMAQSAELTNEEKIAALAKAQTMIEPGTPEHEAILSTGYKGMTAEKAHTIIEERKQDPNLWPYEKVEEAEAFLAALEAKPEVISTRRGWKRTRPAS